MAFINLSDGNLQPVVVNLDHILFVGPGPDPTKRAIVLDAMMPQGPFSVVVANTLEQIIDKIEIADTPFQKLVRGNGS